MTTEVTYLGKVIRVDSGSVEVEVSNQIPSAAPIINGRLYKIGQIGTFVKLPIGNFTIYGIVASVSNTPSKVEDVQTRYSFGSRFLTVQLVGEKLGDDDFDKGVGTYPTINDEVHLVVEKDLRQIYGKRDAGSIEIGKHSSSEDLSVYVDLHKLVLRHSAILGSTGSGKSNTTVSVLKAILDGYKGSRVILVDPHGEYATAFPKAKVYRINDPKTPLFIPFWLMNFDELAYFLVGAKETDEQRPEYKRFRDLITEYKRENYKLKAGDVNPDFISADSPIPFSIRKLWHELNWWVNGTFKSTVRDDQTKTSACQEDPGNPDELKPARFTSHLSTASNQEPFRSRHEEFYSYEKKILSRIKDTRFNYLFNPGEYFDSRSKNDLHDLLNEWIGNAERLTILDLSGIPFELLDISVGLITRFVYDSMFWGRNEQYTGRNRPLLLAYEEAHSYLTNSEGHNYSTEAVERIFKEGRKFGVGAMVISQRPSEISETILAQVGTFIALRLTNSSDQSIVKASAPDNLISLVDLLPSLRTGEAIVVGEAIKIPSRVRVKLNNPRPSSDDPRLIEGWSKGHKPAADNYKAVVTAIREQKLKGK